MNDPKTKNLLHILKVAKEHRVEVEENSENPGIFIVQDDGTEIKVELDGLIESWFPIQEEKENEHDQTPNRSREDKKL